MRDLHEKGWDVDMSITTIDEAVEEILKAVKQDGKAI